jgi:protein phosphatase
MTYSIGINTNTGPKARNEDSVLVAIPEDTAHAVLMIVADGMGGAKAGHLASQQTVQVLKNVIIDRGLPTRESASQRLREAIEAANSSVHATGKSSPDYEGMGSTVVTVLVMGNTYWVAHVGDSRAYMIRDEQIKQLTQDHTWVTTQIRDGKLTQKQADDLQLGHVLDRALGPEGDVQIDLFTDDVLSSGDILVLCSDGLSGVVEPEEIAEIACSHPAQAAADLLVEKALAYDTRDNVSVVVFQFE